MSALETDLLNIEKKFWSGDESYYRQHADTACLIAFAEMAGLMSNSELAATVKEGNRWRELNMKLKGFVRPNEDVAILTYEASAERAAGEPYHALVSTGYVRRKGGWKMMFHSQTPIEKKKAA